jgi:hypothetical protein
MRFDPSELERCIRDIKFNEMVSNNARDSEIKLLQVHCNLALALAKLKPLPEDDLKSF